MAEINVVTVTPPPAITPAATPPPEQAKPPVVIPTAEELRTRTREDFAAMGWGAPPEGTAPEKVAPEASAPAPEAKEPEPALEEPAPEPLTQEQVISRTARETALEVSKALRPTESRPPASPDAPPFEMTEEDKESYRILKWLEQAEPAKYRGMPARFLDYLKKAYAYQDGWLAEHPGSEYDANADEHNAFYSANQFPVTAEMLEQAKFDMIAEQRAEAKVRPLQIRMDAMETERIINAAQPTIEANLGRVALRMIEHASPEMAALLKDSNGNPSFSQDKIDAAIALDPIAHSILDGFVFRIKPLIIELEKTVVERANYKLDTANNGVHAQIDRYAKKAERDMASAPAEVQLSNGRQWIPVLKMASMRQEIAQGSGSNQEKEQAMADLNASYWTLSVDHLEELIAIELGQEAKALIAATDGLAKKKYGEGTPRRAAPAAVPANQPLPPTPRPVSLKPRSPSTSAPSDLTTTGRPGGGGEEKIGETVSKALFG